MKSVISGKINEVAYWILFSSLKGFRTSRINQIILKFTYDFKITPENFFSLGNYDWKIYYGMSEEEINLFKSAKSKIHNYLLLAKSLHNEGIDTVPLIYDDYPKMIKKNLSVNHSPSVIYLKGDKKLFNFNSVSIPDVDCLSGNEVNFTKEIVKHYLKRFKIIVTGINGETGREILRTSIKYIGKNIIVLPGDILSCSCRYKEFNKQISSGDLTVLSSDYPERNNNNCISKSKYMLIFGLSDEIFVPCISKENNLVESLKECLRKGRKVFIGPYEKQNRIAYKEITEYGAIPFENSK